MLDPQQLQGLALVVLVVVVATQPPVLGCWLPHWVKAGVRRHHVGWRCSGKAPSAMPWSQRPSMCQQQLGSMCHQGVCVYHIMWAQQGYADSNAMQHGCDRPQDGC